MNTSLVYSDEEEYFPSYVDAPYQWQALTETTAVLVLCFVTFFANFLTGISLAAVGRKVIDFYLLSLCVADLLTSVAVVPLSLAAKSNILSDGGHLACAISGYMHVSLCAVRMYTLMWTAVDRYLAVRKILRYDGIQTKARSQCWVLFSWVTATCLCSPPLLGDSRGHFYQDGFLCLLNVNSMLPYSITLGCLVLIPSILTMLYTYIYIFTSSNFSKGEHDRKSSFHIVTTFMITLQFAFLWFPWCLITLIEYASGRPLVGSSTHFWLLFLGESYAMWAPLTFLCLCQRCRDGFTVLCVKTPSDVQV